MPNTVKLKSYTEIMIEHDAGGTVTPGFLLELNSSDQVIAHSKASETVAPPYVAQEQFLEGKGIDDDYSSGNKVNVWIPQRGDEAYMWLNGGENASKYDWLESAGDGRLKVHSVGSSAGANEFPNQLVAQALEAVDASESASSHKRIKVRIV